MTETKKTKKDLILHILFITGIVFLILVLSFAIIKFLPLAFSSLASVGSSIGSSFREEKVNVSVNNPNLKNGDRFVVSWEYQTEKNGVFNLKYRCEEDLSIRAITQTEQRIIICNTNYLLPLDSNSIQLEVHYEKANSFTDLPIEVLFIETDNNNTAAKGEVLVTIQNTDNSAPIGDQAVAILTGDPVEDTAITSPATTPVSTTEQSTVIAPVLADLAILNPVVIDNRTVQFTVMNIGGRASGNWYLSYSVPGDSVKTSPLQISLSPGQGIRYTLRYDDPQSGSIVIVADSTSIVNETSKINNIVAIPISSGGSSGNNYFNPNDRADLEIRNLEVGYMSGSRFISDDTISERDDAAIKFTVANRGGRNTGTWRFEVAETPYENNKIFRSDRQNSLSPGQSVEILVRFDRPNEGRYRVEVNLDPDRDIHEETRNNNTGSKTLWVERY